MLVEIDLLAGAAKGVVQLDPGPYARFILIQVSDNFPGHSSHLLEQYLQLGWIQLGVRQATFALNCQMVTLGWPKSKGEVQYPEGRIE